MEKDLQNKKNVKEKPTFEVNQKILIDSPDTILKMIELDWKDIHHSRNQDWKYWAIIGILFAGLFSIIKDSVLPIENKKYIFIGILWFISFISIWASLISKSHWILHIKKAMHIKWLSNHLFFDKYNAYPIRSKNMPKLNSAGKFIVNGLIFTLYWSLGILCFILSIIIYLNPKIDVEYIFIFSLIIFLITMFFSYIFTRKKLYIVVCEINKKYREIL